jgi:hypothetical protein
MGLHNLFRRALPVLVCALAAVSAQAGVVKWKDANGQIHYGDRAPDGITADTVHVSAAPTPRPAPEAAQAPGIQPNANMVGEKQRTPADERQAHSEEADRGITEGMAAAAKFQREVEARNNKELIAKCKAARETYCDKGADAIRKQQYEHDLGQAAAQSDAAMRRGGVVPQSQRIRPRAPCEWPRKCDSK